MSQLFSLLIPPNSTVTVQQGKSSQDAAGQSVTDYSAVVADDVPCVISQVSAARDRFDGGMSILSGKLRGDDASLGRQDTRLVVKTSTVPGLAGRTLRVDSVAPHPGSPNGLVPPTYSVQWSEWKVPA